MITGGREKIGQEDSIGKRTIGTNDILIGGIVEVDMHDNTHGKVGNHIGVECQKRF